MIAGIGSILDEVGKEILIKLEAEYFLFTISRN